MRTKPSLSFYTNIPTPYQRDFFKALTQHFVLSIIFYSQTENNRSWQFEPDEEYRMVVLQDNGIAKMVQKKVVDFHFSNQILRVVKEDKSDYVIVGGSYWIPDAAAALWSHHRRGKKVVYFSEPLFVTQNPLKYFAKWTMLRILNICCDALFCIGKKAADSFRQLGVTVPAYMIPYNIDEGKFTKLDPEQIALYRKTYNPNDDIVLLSSGALVERKGMDILILAMRQISIPNIKLIIIGDGPEKARLETLAAEDDRIVFAGFRTEKEMPYFFGIADVFVFASRYDGWAVVINEAVAAGVPVICSDAVGAGIELITHKVNGWLCENENVADFANAMTELVTQKEIRETIQQNARALIPLISSSYYAQYVYDLFTKTIVKKKHK